MIRPGLLVAPSVVALVLGLGWRARARVVAPPPAPVPAPASAPEDLPFSLTERSASAGLVFTPGKFVPHPSLKNLAPRLGSLGVSVAVVDYDGDGWPDVFVTDPARGGRSALFRNRRDGTFEDVAAKAGLARAAGEAGAMRALFFDSRNSGRQDLLLTTSSCTVFMAARPDGTYRDETARSGLRRCGVSYATNAVDVDGDGLLDVVVADYFRPVDFADPKRFDFMPNSGVAADNGGPITVYRNRGDGAFEEVPGAYGIRSRGWTLAVSAYDLRGSGRPDLYFATDFNSDQLYFNEGGGRLRDASRLVENKYSRNGMTAEIADLDDDGRAAVYVTNIHAPPYQLGTNVLWKLMPGGRFADVAGELGVGECGWAWGAKFVDLSGSGKLDLVVTNGYISAAEDKDYWYESGLMTAAAGAVSSDARRWPPMGDASMAGRQKKCVFRNAGWGFEDVTDRTGWADDRSDGRGLAVIDAMNDGSQSLLEAAEGQPLRFYRHQRRGANHWIGFALAGTRSNRGAWGARVVLKTGGRTLTRELEPGNGFMSQSDARLYFGLGPEGRVESAEVRWPSGAVQTLAPADLVPDRYHRLAEPALSARARPTERRTAPARPPRAR